jgi:hypothetical protein
MAKSCAAVQSHTTGSEDSLDRYEMMEWARDDMTKRKKMRVVSIQSGL